MRLVKTRDRDLATHRKTFWIVKEQQRLEGDAFLAARDEANVNAWLARFQSARNAACKGPTS
jgi:hypothetical protein